MAETGTHTGGTEPKTAADKALLDQGGNLHKVLVQTPYQEYPRHLHKLVVDKKSGEHKQIFVEVTSDEEKAAKLADGWSLDAIPLPPVDEDAEVAAPASAPAAGGGKGKKAKS